MTEIKGAMVLNELIIPIVDISFIDELIVVTALLRGPVRAGSASSYTINGQDGKTIFGGPCQQVWPDLSEDQYLKTAIGFNIDGKMARHQPQVQTPGSGPGFSPWVPPGS